MLAIFIIDVKFIIGSFRLLCGCTFYLRRFVVLYSVSYGSLVFDIMLLVDVCFDCQLFYLLSSFLFAIGV